jgi:hypothetical protein
MPAMDVKKFWHRKVTNKFRNDRKRKFRHLPSFQNKSAVIAAKKSACVSVTPPGREEGDDDVAIEKMLKLMERGKKLTTEETTVLLRKTFSDRRDFILKEKPTVETLKQKYGSLFTESELINEFERVVNVNVRENFNAALKSYAPNFKQLRKPKGRNVNASFIAHLCSDGSDECDFIPMIARIPSHLSENVAELFMDAQSFESVPVTPFISLDRTQSLFTAKDFQIYADSEMICSCDDIKTAIILFVAVFFIFNIDYPKKIRSTCIFFANYVMKIADNASSDRARSLMARLEKF